MTARRPRADAQSADGIRIQKYLSRAGRASRREAEALMQSGRVRVNGVVVTELGVRVVPGRDVVEVDGERVDDRGASASTWIIFFKPVGVITTRRDPHGGATVYDVLPEELRALKYVGRLDKDAEGLLLLTDDGDAANRLAHPSGEVEREYWLEVAGTVGRPVVQQLLAGVELGDGPARAKRAAVIEAGPITSTMTVVLTEGRKREVRRMMSAVGHAVLKLRRVRFGSIRLGSLEPGGWRVLTDEERAKLLADT
ncbi:MAG: rRNA pseudouridine synthase [Gemmatimonadetes bacterium]|nr:rRNA pseudouridine synthase [Gemmatimonadota bacterium]